jgi:hypothetical protein
LITGWFASRVLQQIDDESGPDTHYRTAAFRAVQAARRGSACVLSI